VDIDRITATYGKAQTGDKVREIKTCMIYNKRERKLSKKKKKKE